MFRRRRLSESLRDENVSGTDDRVFVCPEESSCVYKIEHIDMTNYQRYLLNISDFVSQTTAISFATLY